MNPIDFFVETLRTYPPVAVFLALGIGFLIGPIKIAGFNLGNVTATLLAGVVIGQLGIQVSGDLKSTLFLIFLFAVGYGVGPQFVRGLSTDGPKQILFALSVLVLCLIVPFLCALVAGLPLGYGAGMYAGSQTISAAIGVASDQINAMGLSAEQTKTYTDQIPIAYAVTYIWGTIGSAIILAQLGPRLLGIDLPAACREYEAKLGGGTVSTEPGITRAYHDFGLRAYRIDEASGLTGTPVRNLLPSIRVFVERLRRGTQIIEADGNTVLQPGDIVAFSGRRALLVEHLDSKLVEVEDKELLNAEAEILDVYVTNKALAGRTLADVSTEDWARGVYARKIVRSLVEIPVLPGTTVERGDIVTLVGAKRHVEAAIKALGFADRPVETTDIAFLGWGLFAGAMVGALTLTIGGIPIGLSTSGGALLAGLVLGWLRSTYPAFGTIPAPALWLMNTLGLNIFIAVVGIGAGPGFVAGLQEVGISLLIWGIVATSVPMIASVLIGHYVFRFHPAILFGACAGVRTTTAALGMIQEAAKSKVPALGYGMPYAIGNTLLTIFGLVIVIMLAPSGGP
ncbi:aspartate-alanine antiporter [Sinorhizobium sp. A49]|uniref:aspartate-alanine antiporter n=1 Tax=Sinorhizobium sp. A49 TaxID=1945861 RepID=UPI001FDABE9A|nr:aspartate-alanine antiporter [Sinorhizobium sp. A49]